MMVLLSDMDNSTFLWSIFRYPFTAVLRPPKQARPMERIAYHRPWPEIL